MVISGLAHLLASLPPFADRAPLDLAGALHVPPRRKVRGIALDLARLYGEAVVDRAAASALAADLARQAEIASAVAVYPRLYFDLRRPVAVEILERALEGRPVGLAEENRGRLVNVSFCSPNANKSLHLGHARNMFLGMSVSRLLERAGCEVFRTCNYSDTGIHIMKAYAAWERLGDRPELQGLPADVVASRCYQAYESAPKDFADPQERLDRAFRPGAPLFAEVHEWTERVIAEFEQTFARYGVSFHWTLRESENLPWIEALVRSLDARGALRHDADGDAFVEVPVDGGVENVYLVRKGGSPLYMSQLLASGVRRFERFGARLTRICALAGAEQKDKFDRLRRVQERFDIPCARRYHYLDFGLVFGGGARIRSREAHDFSLAALEAALLPRVAELCGRLLPSPPVEDSCRAHIVHFFLKRRRQQRLDFQPEEIERFGRDSLWAVRRAFLALRQEARGEAARPRSRAAEERLTQILLRYPSVVEEAIASLDPALLVRVGLEIARAVEEPLGGEPAGADRESRRLAAVAARVLADSARLWNVDLETPAVLR